ncbi:MAG TPA: diadenylate cyclase [Syntrophales bacterium]|nr:diadenylate cyclase [Syntrophales bacterium]HPO35324.1 diadenylate cyclase [Syntrophales bacterium]
MASINKTIFDFGYRIACELKAKALLTYAEAVGDIELPPSGDGKPQIILATKSEDNLTGLADKYQTITVPNVSLTRLGQVKIAITKGIAMGIFHQGDKIVCLSGVPRFGYVDSIFVIDVGREFEILTSENFSDITEDIQPEVFGEVLNIALELAAQGREGRKVGTTFILGDHERVLQLSRQMIINPFQGYKEEDRNILNPNLKETIKEFSALDGAFIIRGDGVLITAGRHLSAALESKDFPQGLGSRHISAAGITSVTKALAVVLSESSGNVSIFKDGKIFVTIEKPIEH